MSARLEDTGFGWDFREVALSTDAEWETFLARLYPAGVKAWPRKKWAAIRAIAVALTAYPDESAFQANFFDGKTESAALNKDDIRRLDDMVFAFIRYTNAQYIVRNMGGNTIKNGRGKFSRFRS